VSELPRHLSAAKRAVAPCPFDLCDGTGFVIDEEARTATECRCRESRVALRRVASIESRLGRSLPKKYRTLSWDRHPLTEIAQLHPGVTRAARRFADDIDAHVDAGDSLWLLGNKGTGKTTLAYMVSAAALRNGRSVLAWNTVDLLNRLRDSYDSDSTIKTHEIIEATTTVDLLQLEDLAVQRPTDWVLEQLYTIINLRYENELSIVFTSDVPYGEKVNPLELADAIGERTHSRLVEMIRDEPLLMLGRDMRTRPAGTLEPARQAAQESDPAVPAWEREYRAGTS
jgi:DNA replication protein DnaC